MIISKKSTCLIIRNKEEKRIKEINIRIKEEAQKKANEVIIQAAEESEKERRAKQKEAEMED